MNLSPGTVSPQPAVKCSSCGVAVDLVLLSDHVCHHAPAVAEAPFRKEPADLSDEYSTYPLQRIVSPIQDTRPSLPRLDSSLSSRSGRGIGLKEAASIAHDLGLPSPLSAGPGRKSPRLPSVRKASAARVAKGPPSPDLPISQDCAFPPFPMSKPKRTNTDNQIKVPKPRSLSRANTYEAPKTHSASSSVHSSSSSSLLKRRASGSSSVQRSRQGTIEEVPSPASTAPTSPRLSVDGRHVETEPSKDHMVSMSPLEPTATNSTSDDDHGTMSDTPHWPMSGRGSPAKSVATTYSTSANDENEPAMDFSSKTQEELDAVKPQYANDGITFDQILQASAPLHVSEPRLDPSRQPSYRAKRPPPLTQPDPFAHEVFPAPASARSAKPPQSGGLGRTLTNLFSRKRSQSVSSKKAAKLDMDSPRLRALAPDPPPVPTRGEGEFGTGSTSPESYFPPIESSTIQVSTPKEHAEPRPDSESDESERTEKADSHQSNNVDFDFKFGDDASATPKSQDSSEPATLEKDLEDVLATIAPTQDTTEPGNAADLRRASIDSASSYGSIRYSNHTVSSRSSPPPSEETANKISAALRSGHSPSSSVDLPLPLKSHTAEAVPDSPTDPSYRAGGHLSPVSDASAGAGRTASPDGMLSVPLQTPPASQVRMRRPSTPAGTRGVCRGCANMILAGQKSVSSKDGRLTGRYHKECFVCRTCRNPFATADFYVHNDHPYCGHDYHVVNNTLCAACGTGIEGQYLETSLGSEEPKKFHSRCLTCATCRTQLNDDYFEFHGRVYCERDAFRAANGPSRSPYDNAPSRPSPLNREYINSGELGLKGRFPERRTTKLMMT